VRARAAELGQDWSVLSHLRLRQPPTRKKVIELAVGGPVGRWFARRNWAAFVLPLPFACVIFYWNTRAPDPYTRVHEFVHVEQDEAHPFWIVFWVSYLAQHVARGYRGNPFEAAARAVEHDARVNGLPEWAIPGAPELGT
jgi:hypothetical protein